MCSLSLSFFFFKTKFSQSWSFLQLLYDVKSFGPACTSFVRIQNSKGAFPPPRNESLPNLLKCAEEVSPPWDFGTFETGCAISKAPQSSPHQSRSHSGGELDVHTCDDVPVSTENLESVRSQQIQTHLHTHLACGCAYACMAEKKKRKKKAGDANISVKTHRACRLLINNLSPHSDDSIAVYV